MVRDNGARHPRVQSLRPRHYCQQQRRSILVSSNGNKVAQKQRQHAIFEFKILAHDLIGSWLVNQSHHSFHDFKKKTTTVRVRHLIGSWLDQPMISDLARFSKSSCSPPGYTTYDWLVTE